MQISERTINTALNQLADTYEHGPEIYCFGRIDFGNPNAGDEACVLGHMQHLLYGRFWGRLKWLDDVAKVLGHSPASEFYKTIRRDSDDGYGLGAMSQAEVAVALRKYAQAYHPVPDKVALVIVKPQALAA